jgi:hypothetical protein
MPASNRTRASKPHGQLPCHLPVCRSPATAGCRDVPATILRPVRTGCRRLRNLRGRSPFRFAVIHRASQSKRRRSSASNTRPVIPCSRSRLVTGDTVPVPGCRPASRREAATGEWGNSGVNRDLKQSQNILFRRSPSRIWGFPSKITQSLAQNPCCPLFGYCLAGSQGGRLDGRAVRSGELLHSVRLARFSPRRTAKATASGQLLGPIRFPVAPPKRSKYTGVPLTGPLDYFCEKTRRR